MSDQIKRLNIADEKFSKKKLLGFSMVRLGNCSGSNFYWSCDQDRN